MSEHPTSQPPTGGVSTDGRTALGGPDDAGRSERSAERIVSAFFLLSAAGAVFFFVTYWIHAKNGLFVNALLGTSLAVALFGMGMGAVLWAKMLMPAEEAVQERHPFGSPQDSADEAGRAWNAGVAGSGIARRPLLRRSLLLAGGLLVLPVLAPLRSLGEKPKGELKHTRWSPGARLVLADGTPLKLDSIELNGIATVFPEGHTDVESGASSSALLIRLPVGEVTDRIRPKSHQGYVVFSQICTHAGCPARLYSQQTHTLVCPCHQSQFKVLQGAKPVAGPATRPLPQLAITASDDGYLRAVRDFDEPVGPGFWERS